MTVTVYVARYNSGIAVYDDRKAAQNHCLTEVLRHRKNHPTGTFRWHEAPESRGSIDNLFIDPGMPGEVVAHHTGAEVWRMPVLVVQWLALYEGAEPALFSTPEAARAYCDDLATAEARGRCWDWMPEQDGVQEQWWTHEDDDRPVCATGGTVTALRTDAES